MSVFIEFPFIFGAFIIIQFQLTIELPINASLPLHIYLDSRHFFPFFVLCPEF